MKTITKQIKVMQAFADGKEIEYYDIGINAWNSTRSPMWSWCDTEYRTKPGERDKAVAEMLSTITSNNVAAKSMEELYDAGYRKYNKECSEIVVSNVLWGSNNSSTQAAKRLHDNFHIYPKKEG